MRKLFTVDIGTSALQHGVPMEPGLSYFLKQRTDKDTLHGRF